MLIHAPMLITARLLPGVKVGDAYISIEDIGFNSQGRTEYRAYLDMADGTEHVITDLCSGVGGGSIEQGMESLLSFLSAAAEAYRYEQRTGRESDNAGLFAPAVVAWASENDDEITSLQYELQEQL